MQRSNYTWERFPGQYAYDVKMPNVEAAACRHVAVLARGPPSLGVHHTISFGFERNKTQTSMAGYVSVTRVTTTASPSEHQVVLEDYLPLLLREINDFDAPHGVLLRVHGSSTAGIVHPDGPWRVDPATLTAHLTTAGPTDLAELYTSRVYKQWEVRLLRRLPPILGEQISAQCTYDVGTTPFLPAHRYDGTDELLAILPDRERVVFDLYWGVTSGERVASTEIAKQTGKKHATIMTLLYNAHAHIARRHPRPLDIVERVKGKKA